MSGFCCRRTRRETLHVVPDVTAPPQVKPPSSFNQFISAVWATGSPIGFARRALVTIVMGDTTKAIQFYDSLIDASRKSSITRRQYISYIKEINLLLKFPELQLGFYLDKSEIEQMVNFGNEMHRCARAGAVYHLTQSDQSLFSKFAVFFIDMVNRKGQGVVPRLQRAVSKTLEAAPVDVATGVRKALAGDAPSGNAPSPLRSRVSRRSSSTAVSRARAPATSAAPSRDHIATPDRAGAQPSPTGMVSKLFAMFSTLPLVGNTFFNVIRNQVVSLLAKLHQGIIEDGPRSRAAKEAITTVIRALNEMETYDEAKISPLRDRLNEFSILIDGVLGIAGHKAKLPIEPQAKELLQAARSCCDSHSNPDQIAYPLFELLRDISDNGKVGSLFFNGARRNSSDDNLIMQIDQCINKLISDLRDYDRANNGGVGSGVGGAGAGAVDAPLTLTPEEYWDKARATSEELIRLIQFSPIFYNGSSDPIAATLRVANEQGLIDAATAEPDITVRVSQNQAEFRRTSVHFCLHQTFSYFVESLPPFKELISSKESSTSFRDHLVHHINNKQLGSRVSRIFLTWTAPLFESIFSWGVNFIKGRIEFISTRLVTKLSHAPNEATEMAILGKLQNFFDQYTKATKASENGDGDLDTRRAVHLHKLHKQNEIASKIERFFVFDLLPSLNIPSILIRAENYIKNLEGNQFDRQLLGGVCRLALASVRVCIVTPVNGIINWTSKRVLLLTLHRLKFAPKLIATSTTALKKDISRFDAVRESISSLLKVTAIHIKHKRQTETTTSLLEEAPHQIDHIAADIMEGTIGEFFVALHAHQTVKNPTQAASFDRSKAPQISFSVPLIPDAAVKLALHHLPVLGQQISTYASLMLTDIWRAAIEDKEVFSQVVQERIYSLSTQFMMAFGQPKGTTTKSSGADLDSSLKLIYQRVNERIFENLGRKNKELLTEFYSWINSYFNGETDLSGHPTGKLLKELNQLEDQLESAQEEGDIALLEKLKEIQSFIHSVLKEYNSKYKIALLHTSEASKRGLTELNRKLSQHLTNLYKKSQKMHNRHLIKLEQSAWDDMFLSQADNLEQCFKGPVALFEETQRDGFTYDSRFKAQIEEQTAILDETITALSTYQNHLLHVSHKGLSLAKRNLLSTIDQQLQKAKQVVTDIERLADAPLDEKAELVRSIESLIQRDTIAGLTPIDLPALSMLVKVTGAISAFENANLESRDERSTLVECCDPLFRAQERGEFNQAPIIEAKWLEQSGLLQVAEQGFVDAVKEPAKKAMDFALRTTVLQGLGLTFLDWFVE
ncbi:MAG: hypothetical protein P0S95_02985 [Rhabdochlamydiaceae bacterium]|nr:hypothetical protein [Candidatus Amphrikana amoebophyrae]